MHQANKVKLGPLEVLTIKGDKEGPAFIFFHGFGADAYDLLSLQTVYQSSPRPNWFFPSGSMTVSFAQGYTGKAWFPIDFDLLYKAHQQNQFKLIDQAFPQELSASRKIAEDFIHEIDIPFSKIFLGGFSQGAMLATEIALNAFENPAGLILFSSTLVNKTHWETKAPLRKGLPFFQSHGTEDILLPYSQAKMLENLLIHAGLKGKLHSFHGGHEIPPKILQELSHFLSQVCGN